MGAGLFSGDVRIVPGTWRMVGQVKTIHSSCTVDCATAKKYLAEWGKLSNGGGWYIHPDGSWTWPKHAFKAICSE